MSCRSRLYSRTSRPARWSWARIPSYLSSTQAVGPSRPMISVGVLGRRGEHELERMEEGDRGAAEAIVPGQHGRLADVAGQHPGALDGADRAFEGLGQGRLEEALAEPDPQLAGQDLDDVPGGQRVAPGRGAPRSVRIWRSTRSRSRSRRTPRQRRPGSGPRCRARARPAPAGLRSPVQARRRRPGQDRTTGRRRRPGRRPEGRRARPRPPRSWPSPGRSCDCRPRRMGGRRRTRPRPEAGPRRASGGTRPGGGS